MIFLGVGLPIAAPKSPSWTVGRLDSSASPPSTCVLSANFANAQYTVPIGVGTPPQTLNAVPDSGSFELIMAAAGCEGCEGHPLCAAIRDREPKTPRGVAFGRALLCILSAARIESLARHTQHSALRSVLRARAESDRLARPMA
eukprot:820185-Prymnesium_polylepis.1